jgi:hypothetical protein
MFRGSQSGNMAISTVSHQSIFLAGRFNGVKYRLQSLGNPGNVGFHGAVTGGNCFDPDYTSFYF